jgi:hypothetical protein
VACSEARSSLLPASNAAQEYRYKQWISESFHGISVRNFVHFALTRHARLSETTRNILSLSGRKEVGFPARAGTSIPAHPCTHPDAINVPHVYDTNRIRGSLEARPTAGDAASLECPASIFASFFSSFVFFQYSFGAHSSHTRTLTSAYRARWFFFSSCASLPDACSNQQMQCCPPR